MASDDKRIKYSDSPFAPDWARAPEKRSDVITSFGKPIPEAEDNPHLDFGNQENSASKAKTDEAADQLFKPTVEQIEEILWQDANDDIGVYCIMDGYWADGLYGRLLTSDDISWAHMFQGDVATRNIQQAPFIIALKRGHKLTKWLIEEGWGQGWGIYFTASTHKAHLLYGNPRINDKRFLPSNEEQLKLGNLTKGPEDPLWKMRRHFRQFSDVYLESENKIVDFRYYDPWVLPRYMIFSGYDERNNFIGPVNFFLMEIRDILSRKISKNYYYMVFLQHMKVKNMIKKEFEKYTFKINEEKYITQEISYKRINKEKFDLFTNQINDSMLFHTENYLKHISKNKLLSTSEIKILCAQAAITAKSIGLTSFSERLKFTICTLRYGINFEKEDKIISSIIANKKYQPATIMQRINSLLAR